MAVQKKLQDVLSEVHCARFIYNDQKIKQQIKKNRYVNYMVCSLSQSIKWRG